MKHLFAVILAVSVICGSSQTAQAQNFVETEFWNLNLKEIMFGKVQPQGSNTSIYYWFLYRLENPTDRPRKVNLRIFAMINLVRKGVSVADVPDFDGFKKFKLPATPDGIKKEFDNTPHFFKLKRYYDSNYTEARGAVQAQIKRRGFKDIQFKHTSEIGVLAPKAKVEAVAIFKDIDKQMDYTGIIIKGLRNRVVIKRDHPYVEDRVRMVKYHSPGDATNAYENPIWKRGVEWVVMKRTKVQFPSKP